MILLSFLLNLLFVVVMVGLGGVILLAGRRLLWVTLSVVSTVAVANLLAVLVAGGDSGIELVTNQSWWLVLAAVAAGALGVYLGRNKLDIAVLVVGFIAGADLSLWFYKIWYHISTRQAQLSDNAATVLGLVVLLIGGLIGIYIIRHYREETLILIAMAVGVDMISQALRLNRSSDLTAVFALSLSLLGVVVQYTAYLREQKRNQPLAPPPPVMMEPPITERYP